MAKQLRQLFKKYRKMDAADLIYCILCGCSMERKKLSTFPECSHSFCYDCLSKHCQMTRMCTAVVKVAEVRDLGCYCVQCPVCLLKCDGHRLHEELPVTHAVFRLCQNISIRRDKVASDVKCDECQKASRLSKRPSFRCTQCSVSLCGSCWRLHRSHRWVKWSQLQRHINYQCKVHKKNITHYCTDCRQLVCDTCTQDMSGRSHGDHQTEAFAELSAKQQQFILKDLQQVQKLIEEKQNQKTHCKQALEQAGRCYEQTRKEIKRQTEFLIKNINKNSQTLLCQLEQMQEKLKTLYSNHTYYLDYNEYVLTGIQSLLNRSLLPGEESLVMLHQEEIEKYLQTQISKEVKDMEEKAMRNLLSVPNYDADIRYSTKNGLTLGRLSLAAQDRLPSKSEAVTPRKDTFLISGGQKRWEKGSFLLQNQPQGILFENDKANCLLVAEKKNGRISRYKDDGTELADFVKLAAFLPKNMALDPVSGYLYVTDSYQRTVMAFDKNGQDVPLRLKHIKFHSPSGIATDGKHIVVSDMIRPSIKVFEVSGEIVSRWDIDSKVASLEFLILDNKNRIVVSDGSNHRISVYSLSGQHQFSFSECGSTSECLKSPADICQDTFGHYLVADSGNSRVCRFTENGVYDSTVIQFSPGTFQPCGIALSSSGDLALTDRATDRIFLYTLYNL